MKFRIAWCGLGVLGLAFLLSCSINGSPSTTGFLYITSQGNSQVSLFTIDLNNGKLSTTGNAVATGTSPVASVLAPSNKALYVLNGPGGAEGSVSVYKVNADGSIAASGSAVPVSTATSAKAIAIDPAGKFVFVASQGDFAVPLSGKISVFQVGSDGISLTAVGPPFSTNDPQFPTIGTGPSGLAVSADSKFLYVANQFIGKVSAYSVSSSGALTDVVAAPYAVGTAPSALAIWNAPSGTPAGTFLYVTNQGSNNVSAFSVCDKATALCPSPDGTLAPVTGSPFSVGLAPVALAVDPLAKYLYVVAQNSNQVGSFVIASGSGALSATSTSTISTGDRPVGITIHPEQTNQTTEFVYVPNSNSATVSAFSLDTTTGNLGLAQSPVTTGGQPSAVATF